MPADSFSFIWCLLTSSDARVMSNLFKKKKKKKIHSGFGGTFDYKLTINRRIYFGEYHINHCKKIILCDTMKEYLLKRKVLH